MPNINELNATEKKRRDREVRVVKSVVYAFRAHSDTFDPAIAAEYVRHAIDESISEACAVASSECDVCRSPISAHGPTMEHPVAFTAGRDYEREACAKIAESIVAEACRAYWACQRERTLDLVDGIAAAIRARGKE